jgi:hypothetical protein
MEFGVAISIEQKPEIGDKLAWADFKRHQEYFPLSNRPYPYEMSLYFDV